MFSEMLIAEQQCDMCSAGWKHKVEVYGQDFKFCGHHFNEQPLTEFNQAASMDADEETKTKTPAVA